MPTQRHGRHEHGQNFLTDPAVIATVVDLVDATSGPIVEIGPGDGALTARLVGLRRPLTAVEIDPRCAARLRRRLPGVDVVVGDFLTYRLPTRPHVLVGNLPFSQTTAMLRHVLHAPGWTDAVLLVQWEVARRRAGIGAATLMTAQWAPWFAFTLHGRVPARAFRPRPGVDGGLLTIERRTRPLIDVAQQGRYQALAHRVFTGSGRGLGQILARHTALGSPRHAARWLARHGLTGACLPGALPLDAWVELFQLSSGRSPGHASGISRAAPGRGRR